LTLGYWLTPGEKAGIPQVTISLPPNKKWEIKSVYGESYRSFHRGARAIFWEKTLTGKRAWFIDTKPVIMKENKETFVWEEWQK
jgi:hypothetical protein